MKQFKTLVALVLALVMVFALCTSAMAATIIVQSGSTAGDGTASQDVLKDENYSAYKILNYTASGTAFNYYLTTAQYDATNNSGLGKLLESVGFAFTASADGTQYYVNNSASLTDAAHIANALYAIKDSIAAVAIAKSENQTATADKQAVFSNLDTGYWFVTSSLGALTSLQSYDAENIIVEKNAPPSQDKKQQVGTTAPTAATGYTDDGLQVQVGDKVWYQIEVTDGTGTSSDITITDSMTTGLTLDQDSITLYEKIGSANETALAPTKTVGSSSITTYEIPDAQKSAQGFQVVFKAAYVATLNPADKLYIRFSATVNSDAVTHNKETNTSTLTYSNQSSQDHVDVTPYKFQLDKTKNAANNYADLYGARFELYRGSVADANKIWFVSGTPESGIPVLNVVGQGASAPVSGAFSDIRLTDNTKDNDSHSLNSTKVIFKGLDLDNYVLRETEAPEGYNMAADQTVQSTTLVAIDGTITDVAAAIEGDAGVVTVINEAGSQLPSTGGIGTTIFYVAGIVLVLGAAAVILARRKAEQE